MAGSSMGERLGGADIASYPAGRRFDSVPVNKNNIMSKQLEADMSFKEMITNMFDLSWMSQNEIITICAAAEMYADGRAKHFTNWVTQEKSPFSVTYDDGEFRFATNDEDLTIEQVYSRYKEWRKNIFNH